MAELIDIAKKWKQKSAQAIYPGFPYPQYKTGSSRAFKTGNLLRKFVGANAENQIIETKIRSNNFVTYEVVLDIAPTDAEYGKYVHNGTRKMGKRPFAEIGAKDVEVQKLVDEFISAKSGAELQKYKDILNPIFKKLGKT
jgi:hypothetical protein